MSTPLLDPSTVSARPLNTGPASGLSRAEWLKLAHWARWLSWASFTSTYIAAALLVRLAGNALFGLGWRDPIAALAVREGIEAWHG